MTLGLGSNSDTTAQYSTRHKRQTCARHSEFICSSSPYTTGQVPCLEYEVIIHKSFVVNYVIVVSHFPVVYEAA